MNIEILDPTYEGDSREFRYAKGLQKIRGATVGILSNGKKGTRPFFDALEKLLLEEQGVSKVVRRTKSNYSAPAETQIMNEVRTWDAMFSGVGD